MYLLNNGRFGITEWKWFLTFLEGLGLDRCSHLVCLTFDDYEFIEGIGMRNGFCVDIHFDRT